MNKRSNHRKGIIISVIAIGMAVIMAVSLLVVLKSNNTDTDITEPSGHSVSDGIGGDISDNSQLPDVDYTSEESTSEDDAKTGDIESDASPGIKVYPEGYSSREELLNDIAVMDEQAAQAGLDYNGYIVTIKHAVHDKTESGEEMHTEVLVSEQGICKASTIEDLLEDYDYDEIVSVEPDYIVTMFDADADYSEYLEESEDASDTADALSVVEPNDQYYQSGDQWHLDVMKAQSAWEFGLEGSSISDSKPIIVAVIDSGVNYDHEDIDASHILEGYSYVTTDTTDVKDQQGHGTFCISEIMATKDNEVGVAGIVPEVYILPLRVFGTSNSAYTSDVVAAINYAADYGVDVISMSLGGEGNSTAQQNACDYAVSKGTLVVAAAGNDGDYTLNYPAATESVIGVGSLGTDTSHTTVSTFSQRGTTNVFCTAPGYKLVGCYYNSSSSYYRASGTSMATPEVAALGAVVKSIDRTIDQDQFKQIIMETSTDLGTQGRDSDYGYGCIDFKAVIESLVDVSGEGVITLDIVNEDGNPVNGADVKIYAENSDTVIEPQSDGTYKLEKGRYTYRVSADKYEDAEGSFFVITAGRTLRIVMEGLSYPAYVTIRNTNGEEITNADITIKNRKNVTQKAESYGSYQLKAGEYTYSVSATGYYTRTGSLTVVDDGENDFDIVIYGDIDVASAKLNVIDEDGNSVSGVDVKIYNSEGGEVEQYADGYYKLYPGTYRYVAESGRFLTEDEEFVITDAQKGKVITITIPMLNPVMWVYFEIVPIFAQVEVMDEYGNVVEPYAAGEYKLLKGTYTYTVTAESYKTINSGFTLTTTGKTISIDMEDDLSSDKARVTFSSNGGSAVDAVTVSIGSKLSRPEDPVKVGYTFEGWYKESSLTTPWNFDSDIILGRTTLYAKWSATEYRIIYIFNDREIYNLSPSTRTYGTTVTKLPVPDIEGWHFEYWCSDVDLKNQITQIPGNKIGDVYVYAYCVQDTGEYIVHFETNGGSSIPDFTAAESNSYLVSPESEPVREGYDFAGWYRDADLTESWDLSKDKVTWEMTLYAAWQPQVYNIIYKDGDTVLEGLEPATYTYKVPVTGLPVPSKTGSSFAGWYEDASLYKIVRSIPSGKTGDITLYAKWSDGSTETAPDDCDYGPDEEGNYPEVSEDGYTLIYNQQQLDSIRNNLYSSADAWCLSEDEKPKYRLACSIQLTGDWEPIAPPSGNFFTGYFDGAGHGIYGLKISTTANNQSLFGRTYYATIENLEVYGSVTGGISVAGIASESYSSDFYNIQNHVDVYAAGYNTSAGNAGGIVSTLHGGTISHCVNYGHITGSGSIAYSTCVSAVGGIMGDTGNNTTAVTIDNCVNYGNVDNYNGIPTGGIVGYFQGSGCSVSDCYNMGNVSQYGSDSTKHTYGTAAGIAGLFKAASSISNCYNAGSIYSAKPASGHNDGEGYDYLVAAIAFYNTASSNYSGCYFLSGSAPSEISIGRLATESSYPEYAYYYTISADTPFAYSAEDDYAIVINGLGDAFAAGTSIELNSGLPALKWQVQPEPVLQFLVRDSLTGRVILDTDITADGELLDDSSAVLHPGHIIYHIEREGYESKDGSLYLGVTDKVVIEYLDPVLYDYSITVKPKDAALTLTNRVRGTITPVNTEETDDAIGYTFQLAGSNAHGNYQVNISKYGYDTIEETFSVDGSSARDYDMTLSEYQNLNFEIRPEDCGFELVVRDSEGNELTPYSGYLYHITEGTVTYQITAKGYRTVTGSVTVPGSTTNISVILEASEGWNGEIDTTWYDADETEYHIYTAEQLAGVASLSRLSTDRETFAGKTVYIEDDIDLGNLPWTPIGEYSYDNTKNFAGTFDGQGHTLSGLYVDGKSILSTGNYAGFFASTAAGAVVKNFTLVGEVTGGTYIGGVCGYPRGSEFSDIDSYVNVTSTSYQAGGIAGCASSAPSVFTRCRNFGIITSTATNYTGTNSYALGGIVGAISSTGTSGEGSVIEFCANYGTVSGYLQSVGGLAGYIGTTGSAMSGVIRNSYNRGVVECAYSGGYTGGILGDAYGSYYLTCLLTNCLNFGEIINANSGMDAGLVGFTNAKSLVLSNCWYDYRTTNAVYSSAEYEGANLFGSSEDRQYDKAVDSLGSAYKMDTISGEPMLVWEDSSSVYQVTFNVVYDTEDNLSSEYDVKYIVKGKDEDGFETEFIVSDGKVSLPSGTYEYIISRSGYEEASGSFNVESQDRTVSVLLNAVKYAFTVTAVPEQASVSVTDPYGSRVEAYSVNDGVSIFYLTNGTYTYNVKLYGYNAVSGNAQISFEELSVDVELQKNPEYNITFSLVPDEGELPDDWTVLVYSDGSRVAEAGSGDVIVLAEGEYTYSAKAKGYETMKGSFTVSEDAEVSIDINKKQTGEGVIDTDWYYDYPDSDIYYIGTAEELRGLGYLVNSKGVTFEGKEILVTDNIDLTDASWTPIGTWSGTHFKGSFNGQRHVISIQDISITGNERACGLFGYMEDASVSDMVLRGNMKMNISIDSSSAAIIYTGGIAGYAGNTTIERVSNQMNIVIKATVTSTGSINAGGITGWSGSGTINSCSSTGAVDVSITSRSSSTVVAYAGGITGYANPTGTGGSFAVTNCYNTGNITSQSSGVNQAAGIVGAANTYNNFTMKNCYNSGIISADTAAALCASSASGTLSNNYYRDDMTSSFGYAKSDADMKTAEYAALLGSEYISVENGYPMLYWENIVESVEVEDMPDKSVYNDLEDFDDTGLTLKVYYSGGTSETVISGWTVKDGSSLRVDKDGETGESCAEVNVHVSFRGFSVAVPVTVNQVEHVIPDEDLSFDVPVPEAGMSADAITVTTDLYNAAISWVYEGNEFTGTFEEGHFYRARVEIDAVYETGKIWNVFSATSAPSAGRILEVRDKVISRNENNHRVSMVAYLTYPACGTDPASFDQRTLHLYHAGDINSQTDHVALLSRTILVKAEEGSKEYSLREIEELILKTGGIQADYSYYSSGLTVKKLTGLSLYELCLDSGLFSSDLSGESTVTIGGQTFTWDQIRRTGNTYDADNNITVTDLPTLLVVAEGSTPLSASRMFGIAVPMQDILEDNLQFWMNGISEVELTSAVHLKQYKGSFIVSAKDGEDISDVLEIDVTDSYGRAVTQNADGTFDLNENEDYTYTVKADGYAPERGSTGTVKGDIIITVELLPSWDGETYSEPDQDENGVYLIYTAEELMWFNRNATFNSDACLMKDITLNPEGSYVNEWKPMFCKETSGPYVGTFDGNDHTIYGLYMPFENEYVLDSIMGSPVLYSDRTDTMGMFGYMGGTVKNLSVRGEFDILDRPDSTLASWFQLGGIAGLLSGTVEGVHTDIKINYTVGTETTSVAGYPERGFPECCDTYIGGIAGSMSSSASISNCYTTGAIDAGGTRSVCAGGIVGGIRSGRASVSYCYSTSDITAYPGSDYNSVFDTCIGGIAGKSGVIGSTGSSIERCFALNGVLDGKIDLIAGDDREIMINRIIGDSSGAELKYNYANEEMTVFHYTVTDDSDYSRNGVNGGNISMNEAENDLRPFTGIGWSEDIWKSASTATLPVFYWQTTGESVTTYPVTADYSDQIEFSFAGGVDADGNTTNTSTVTFTVDIKEGSAVSIFEVLCEGGTMRGLGNYYSISDITGPVTITVISGIMGDVNEDGFVDSRDAAMIRRYAAGKMDLSPSQQFVGDVDKDGSLTTADSCIITGYSLSLIDSLN